MQVEKDLEIELIAADPQSMLETCIKRVESSARTGELMPLLYRIDLAEEIGLKKITASDWPGLAADILKRIALKVAYRLGSDQK